MVSRRFRVSWELLPTLVVFGILLAFTYAFVVLTPHIGFDFINREVILIYPGAQSEPELRVGDQLLNIGPYEIEAFYNDMTMVLEGLDDPDRPYDIIVQRGEEEVVVPWRPTGFRNDTMLQRIRGGQLIAFFYWLVGTVAFLFVRPRDKRWLLLVLWIYGLAIWQVMGSGPSRWHTWYTGSLVRMLAWILIPITLHLHWIFPGPIVRRQRTPGWIPWLVYAVFLLLVTLEWLQLLPTELAFALLVLAFAASVVLLVIHGFRPGQGRDVWLLVAVLLAPVLPALAALFFIGSGYTTQLGYLFTLALILVPPAYLYPIYRRQLGDLEVRVNRLLIYYLYVFLYIAILIAVSLFVRRATGSALAIQLVLILGLIIGLASYLLYSPYQRWIETHLLGLPLHWSQVGERYAGQISSTLNRQKLAAILKNGVMPDMKVERSALLSLDPLGAGEIVYTDDVPAEAIPSVDDLVDIRPDRGPFFRMASRLHGRWVKVILPLRVDRHRVGYWLLGERPPDDFYPQGEADVWRALSTTTAVALQNISQNEQLQRMLRSSINDQDRRQNQMALMLQNDILQQAHRLLDYESFPQPYYDAYERFEASLKATIAELQPEALQEGLSSALNALAVRIGRQLGGQTLSYDIEPLPVRYAPAVELHLFRIIEQALNNAANHAKAGSIRLSGRLTPTAVLLKASDDGVGFYENRELTLPRQFGLAGMYERAAIIGARLEIRSIQGLGTAVTVTWQKTEKG